MELENIKSILKRYNQEHLLENLDKLNEKEQINLLQDISKIDFELLEKLYNSTKESYTESIKDIQAIDNVFVKENMSKTELLRLEDIGKKEIEEGHFTVVTMAGGQGTRLGHTGPKGTYMLNIHGNSKSIFELLIDKLKAAKEKFSSIIPWYIMTSKENHKATIEFFEQNNYFEYGKENVYFFMQGELPMLDMDGKIILNSKSSVKFAADGNGGVFNAITHNILKDMLEKNIKWVYVCGVDNILVNFVDEAFLGAVIDKKMKIGTKSVLKDVPNEKVGIICKRDNKPCVVEYTEIPEELSNKRKSNGELLFSEANIVSNIFSTDILKNITSESMPYHTQVKKCMAYRGGITQEENAYKFETFIFDIYNQVNDLLVYRVKREQEFAPIKNKEGVDSPDTAKILYEKQL